MFVHPCWACRHPSVKVHSFQPCQHCPCPFVTLVFVSHSWVGLELDRSCKACIRSFWAPMDDNQFRSKGLPVLPALSNMASSASSSSGERRRSLLPVPKFPPASLVPLPGPPVLPPLPPPPSTPPPFDWQGFHWRFASRHGRCPPTELCPGRFKGKLFLGSLDTVLCSPFLDSIEAASTFISGWAVVGCCWVGSGWVLGWALGGGPHLEPGPHPTNQNPPHRYATPLHRRSTVLPYTTHHYR